MTTLSEKHCLVCENGAKLLSAEEKEALLKQTPAWQLNKTSTAIERHFSFKNFYQTMSFVNAIAWIANQENHHPDLEVGYNYCHVRYSTHSIKNLTENDFICAAKINQILSTQN